jgi:ribosome maturation factor RimP
MKSAKNIATEVEALISPVAEELGYYIWDVSYVKEGTEWFLRITIDSENGINIDDCENMSRAIDPLLDEADPIEDAYRLEVSSPGIEREIKTDFHLSKCLGETVEAKFYAPLNGAKSVIGVLKAYDSENVTVDEMVIPRKSIAKMNIYFEF